MWNCYDNSDLIIVDPYPIKYYTSQKLLKYPSPPPPKKRTLKPETRIRDIIREIRASLKTLFFFLFFSLFLHTHKSEEKRVWLVWKSIPFSEKMLTPLSDEIRASLKTLFFSFFFLWMGA